MLGLLTPIGILLTGPIAGLLAFGAYMLSKADKPSEEEEEILEEEAQADELKSPESVVRFYILIRLNLSSDTDSCRLQTRGRAVIFLTASS
ncbi:hypothetical protein QNN00_19620 [Bacillus velezensis]|nr:hypothetical protein [Bacillus velezensis]